MFKNHATHQAALHLTNVPELYLYIQKEAEDCRLYALRTTPNSATRYNALRHRLAICIQEWHKDLVHRLEQAATTDYAPRLRKESFNFLKDVGMQTSSTDIDYHALADLFLEDDLPPKTLQTHDEILPCVSYWGSDFDYPVADWKHEVADENTRLGYHDWATAQREAG